MSTITPATLPQRVVIRELLAAAGYDRGTVSRKYLRLGVADWQVGTSTESWLAALRFNEAERAIAQLKLDEKRGAMAGAHSKPMRAWGRVA